MRGVWLRLLLIVLPLAVYGLYLFLSRWRAGHTPPKTPWTILFLLGLSLFAGSFLLWRWEESDVEGTYVPPHVENGKVVPGRVEPAK